MAGLFALNVKTDIKTNKHQQKTNQALIMTENRKKRSGNGIGIGAALGVAFGAAFGGSTGNMAQSIALGIAFGVALGAIFDYVKNRK